MSVKPSRTIFLIDRSEPRFESHTGGKIRKTLKNDGNFEVFVNFRLNHIQNCSVQIKTMKDVNKGYLAFNWIKELVLPNVCR